MVSPPTHAVYVLVPQIDPVGHRMGLDLAALIGEVRAEMGASGGEAYAAVCCRLLQLGSDETGARPV